MITSAAPVWATGHERRQGKWSCFFVSRGNKESCITVSRERKRENHLTLSHHILTLSRSPSHPRQPALVTCLACLPHAAGEVSASPPTLVVATSSLGERERESRQSPVSEWRTTSSRVHTQPNDRSTVVSLSSDLVAGLSLSI